MAILETAHVWATRLFFRNFFRLLLLAISCAQWGCVAWVLWAVSDVVQPPWGHALGVTAIYAVNRTLTARRPLGRASDAPLALRVYSATAFVSLFCFSFLVVSAAMWVVGSGLAGALSAAALPSGGYAVIDGHLGPFRWFVSTGMAGVTVLFVYGYAFGRRQLQVVRVPLTLRGLAPSTTLRIAQISDVHVGQNLSVGELRSFIRSVNELRPDLVCITGDIADSPRADYERFFPILGELRARYGVCAILGNHDHYSGADRVVAELRRWTSFRVLRDEAVTLRVGDGSLHVIGTDDRGRDWARGVLSDARLAQLVAEAPADTPILLLSHRPDVFPYAAAAGVALMLSGHTHGGQLAVPWFRGVRRNLAEFITDFSRGLFERDGCYLYVNSGLGVTGQPIRLFTPREITVVEVRGADPASALT